MVTSEVARFLILWIIFGSLIFFKIIKSLDRLVKQALKPCYFVNQQTLGHKGKRMAIKTKDVVNLSNDVTLREYWPLNP